MPNGTPTVPDTGLALGPDTGFIFYGDTRTPPRDNRSLWVQRDAHGRPVGLAVYSEVDKAYVNIMSTGVS